MIQHVIKGGEVTVEDYEGGRALVITQPSGDQYVIAFDQEGAMWVGKRLKGEHVVEAFQAVPIVETA